MSKITVQSAEAKAKANGSIDYWLLGAALVLVGLGLVMVFSSSGVMAERFNGNRYFFIQRRAPPALTENGGTRVSTSRPMMRNSHR